MYGRGLCGQKLTQLRLSRGDGGLLELPKAAREDDDGLPVGPREVARQTCGKFRGAVAAVRAVH